MKKYKMIAFMPCNAVDDFNREVSGIDSDSENTTARVTRYLDQIAAWRGCVTTGQSLLRPSLPCGLISIKSRLIVSGQANRIRTGALNN